MNIESLKSSSVMVDIEQRYLNLEPRDKQMVTLLSIATILIIILFVIIFPANEFNSKAQQHYRVSLENLQWMQDNKPLISVSKQQLAKRNPGQSLLGIAITHQNVSKFHLSAMSLLVITD